MNQSTRIVEVIDERLKIDQSLSDYFNFYYQPQYCLSTCRLKGFESLLRLNHPQLGVLSPNVFLNKIDNQSGWARLWPVLLKQISKDKSLLPIGAKLAVNVSPAQIEDGTFISILREAIKQGLFYGHNIEVEITEGSMIHDFECVIDIIEMLGALGVDVVLDDFGSGFCGLNYLEKLNVQGIKIDRLLVQNIHTSELRQTIVKSVVEIAKVKECFVLAEGVETKDEMTAVKKLGCHYGQGYYLGRPATNPNLIHNVKF